MAPWKLPIVVAALAVPVVAGFLLAGPALGVAVGALAAVALLVVAARLRPEGPIGEVAREGGARRVLIVAADDLDDPGDVERIARAAGIEAGAAPAGEVRVLVPARIGFLDRWASDVEGARHRAQQRLVVSVAALAKAGIAAEARVGDEDVVQAVEDELQAFPASQVVLASGAEDDDAAARLRERLRAEFHHVRVDS